MSAFCAICIDGVEDLRPGDDGKLECARCRDESPRQGRYSFSHGGVRSSRGINERRRGVRGSP